MNYHPNKYCTHSHASSSQDLSLFGKFRLKMHCIIGDQKVYFYFFKRPECYNQEMLSHSFICLPLPYMEGIVLICNINLYCVMAIFNGTGDMFNR